MAKIYALCDMSLLKKYKIDIKEYVKIAKYFNASIIQYRDKISSLEEKKENLKILKNQSDIPVIINDFLELVQFADGLHIGQEDLINIIDSFGFRSKYEAIEGIRKIIGKKILGLSTHNESEIKEANLFNLDYIGLGAYRSSSTKEVENILGEKLHCLGVISKHPVVAIGGIRLFDNIKNVSYKAIGSDLLKKYLTYS
ncbi:thiamine phosphate synthase [Nitrosophilus kaiyonis]|uniref:thiamine phosphate synthase n=1 Tax=Nitrosophilus kaiyonis TaxID=2930200 RepID=UPI002491765B|nr:thiamine phosphate synthase [Nitrosophilus kaiyonis]